VRYLVSIEPEYERNNDIDRKGDVMEMLKWLRETFEAEGMFLEASNRKIWMVVSFESGSALNRLTCISLFKLGVAPIFRPIFTEAENETAIPASLAFMESAL
jgi:hypothetical protein